MHQSSVIRFCDTVCNCDNYGGGVRLNTAWVMIYVVSFYRIARFLFLPDKIKRGMLAVTERTPSPPRITALSGWPKEDSLRVPVAKAASNIVLPVPNNNHAALFSLLLINK
jgi:hypothetical protein